MTIDSASQIVKNVLSKLGVDLVANELPESNGYGWAIPTEKSVMLLTINEINNQPALRMSSPILFMPYQDILPFYRKLLDLNVDLADVTLGMDRDVVNVANQQMLDGLTPSAVEELIMRFQKSANVLADMLMLEFNSVRYWRPI